MTGVWVSERWSVQYKQNTCVFYKEAVRKLCTLHSNLSVVRSLECTPGMFKF